jgi:hypothetical protein
MAMTASGEVVVSSGHRRGAGESDMGWVLHFYDNIPRNYGSQLRLGHGG